ncbi:MAG: FHA domain-containing protein [Polyangiaceae bacterium]|nr:FHA domain-containing protein [Polyangiaceae bacterium]
MLQDTAAVLVGRANECDIVLLEGMVSRHHARFRVTEAGLAVEDLGSTNGTLVNGERVGERVLSEGDRVLIGTSILKVVWSRGVPSAPSERRLASEIEDDASTTAGGRITGRIDDVSVPELFERFVAPESACQLVLIHAGEVGELVFRGGFIEAAHLPNLPGAPPRKAIHRVLAFPDGAYMIDAYRAPPTPLAVRVAEVLLEGTHLLDELSVLRAKLPGPAARLALARPLGPKLARLEPADLEVVQLAHNSGSLRGVLDQSPETDVDASRRVLNLIDAGYLRISSLP